MSRYDKTIPDHASIDFSIIDFFFNDTDFADWFVDYEPEYGDLYFYFDTFASMLDYSGVRGFGFMLFNTTFNNSSFISWWSVLLVEKTNDLQQVTDKLYYIMLC